MIKWSDEAYISASSPSGLLVYAEKNSYENCRNEKEEKNSYLYLTSSSLSSLL